MLRTRLLAATSLATLASLVAAIAGPMDTTIAQEGEPQETPAERQKRLHAQQIRAIWERVAEAAERSAADLDEAARALEELGAEAQEPAKRARANAKAARTRAESARRRANQAGATVRRLEPDDGVLTPAEIEEARARLAGETHKHAAATRTAAQNKKAYLPPKRAKRSRSRERITETQNFGPGEAPDMGDLDIFSEWQWAINVARGGGDFTRSGGGQKTGHVDIARVSIQPDPKTSAARDMKWGMRRYNLGDTTVVDCDITGIPKEHGIYDSLSGHGLYRGNTFKGLGGQAIQIAYRDQAYEQYQADNLPLTGKPTIILEDNHVVDCGLWASHSGFSWTFFDPGTRKFPATIIVRDCTVVHAWDFARRSSGDRVPSDHPRAIRCPGGLVVHQYQHVRPNAEVRPTEALVIDNCLFDMTQGEMPIAAVRGVETILIEDSCFIARNHRNPHFDVDDEPDRASGKIIIENCVSPKGERVWLRIRKKRVVSMHCPGKRLEIDVKTGEVTELEPVDDPITRLISPLEGRRVRPGIHPQPRGHVDDMGTVQPRYRDAPSTESDGPAAKDDAPAKDG